MATAETHRTYANFLHILRRSTDSLNEESARDEFFSIERLEQYAAYLAGELKVSATPKRGRFILPQLRENGRQLLSAYLQLTGVIREKQSVSPAAEWFVDNFHIVEEQLREIKQDLPKGYYDELPKLIGGELQGYPRVYAIALAIIAHTDSRLDVETLKRFMRSFQSRAPLTIGELWAIAITLRIALVEHLTPLALRIVNARQKRAEADKVADDLLELALQPDCERDALIKLLKGRTGEPQSFDRAFIVQLTQRLRDQDPDVLPAFDWLEQQLAEHHSTHTEQVTQLEHNRQATAQVTVGNIISSMRLLSALDWRDFVESVSLVDPILDEDPAGSYGLMDFATRDRYRHAVERLSKRSPLTELEVVRHVVDRAKQATGKKPRHVGYYLIGDGAVAFEKSIRYRPRLGERATRWTLRHPTFVYLGSLSTLTLLLLVPVLKYFTDSGGTLWQGLLFCLLALIPASEFALSVLNHNVAFFLKPKALPKIDTEEGIPDDAMTMVVVPTLLTKESVITGLLEGLQVHFLANQDPNIYFALLGDFADADQVTLPEDAALLKMARKGIDELNERYATKNEPRFFLFHRYRKFNPGEGKWMGYERKRGKLHEFNRLLRGAINTTFLDPTAPPEFLSKIKYVITLDSDTQLPRDSAHQLIGTILHPLNQPELANGRVINGYGILQPRASVSLVSASRSRFARLFSGSTGLDPYTTACSDVYQDLFGEGSYTGKALYVVDAFEKALKHRVPENTLLSHDLFEGCFARSALVSDVELFDDYPTDYETYASRQHRWIRGDWQIARWLFPRVPTDTGALVKNDLSLFSRWKILDNLRRSLVPTSALLWLLLAWTVLPGSPAHWTLMVVVLFAFPVYATVTNNIFHHRQGVSWRGHIAHSWSEASIQAQQILLMLVFMAEQAWNQVDAIYRVFYRTFVSHKRMLEWKSFSESQEKVVGDEEGTKFSWRNSLGPGPIVAGLAYFLILYRRPEAMPVATPFFVFWLANPFLKNWIKQRPVKRKRPLEPAERAAFRFYARRTWHFFETFVTKQGNYLAPDNFQEEPQPVVAYRTSPTNIGLQLLSLSSAYDFGYVGVLEVIDSAEKTFETLVKLERKHGHFFNWYDTQTLEPLRPQYISTVDSGNLAGHLLTLKHALLELGSFPTNPRAQEGLSDTLGLLELEVNRVQDIAHSGGIVSLEQLKNAVKDTLHFVRTHRWESLIAYDGGISTIKKSLMDIEDIVDALVSETPGNPFLEVKVWLTAALHQVLEFERDLATLVSWSPDFVANVKTFRARQRGLVEKCDEMIREMDFRFLFDEQRKLFVIGFNVADGRRDNSYYDLLASESRLASFVAIAKGEIPQEHWFKLGRQMTAVKSGRALISWTGTMFEYLMPLLVMRRYADTLLDQTYESVVSRQIVYGREQGVPWGVSEAGFNARDLQLIYQYGPFGVPGLGLKRGLSDDLVVSPYSTMLATHIDAQAALDNLRALEEKGAFSRYGFYESIDYTPDRLQKNQKSFILRSFMAHHQGMSLVSMNNLLHDNPMQRRFHAEPLVKATQLLLQERIPQSVTISRPRAEEVHYQGNRFSTDWNPRVFEDVDLPTPRTQLLSNGTYSVMITTSGAGYSRSGGVAISRWREDVTRDHWGQYFYIRNRATGLVWSASHQPAGIRPRKYEVTFAEDKVEFLRRDGRTITHTEIIVSPEDNVEIRRISLTNNSAETREYEITSFMEVVLALPQDDNAHPSFSNLFVQTEYLPTEETLLATRRRRSAHEAQIWAFHVLVPEGEAVGPVQYETDRTRFVGRGRNPSNAFVITDGRPLSDTVGSVLDPIFSLRQSIRIAPGETARVSFATGVAPSREEALRLADKYHDIHIFTRETELAWTKSRVQLRHMNISSDEAHTSQRLAGRIIYSDPSLRPRTHTLAQNQKTQSGLWAYGISGDVPIVLARINSEKDMKMVRELLHAHEYLRLKGLAFDLVFLNETPASYLQALQEEMQRQIRMSGSQALVDKPGGVFARRADLMPKEDVVLLKAVARVDINSAKGTLQEQLRRRSPEEPLPDPLVPTRAKHQDVSPPPALIPPLEFFNGLGGFSDGGRQYVTVLKEGQWTPAPWINVVANEKDFGFLVSEAGAGYTWSVNSRENRLTPWSNDAVSDPIGEAIYLRDEESGEYWTPTPLPIREKETYVVRHGQGYSRFDHVSHGIASELLLFVPLDAEVKISYLVLKNTGTARRHLSVTSYVEWVLGTQRETASAHVLTERDGETGALFARNQYNNEFHDRLAFSHMSSSPDSFTCDRKAFLGRNRGPAKPAGLGRESLSGLFGGGLDPCAALQKKITLEPGEEREILILLGEVANPEDARAIVRRFERPENARAAFKEVTKYWDETLGTIEIQTPDPAMNTLMNRWLLYQTLACRVWARSAFYQSGGAFGFRDQLQDVMALTYSKPQIARAHILTAAARQFKEGDVQHWWHPPTGRGVRTHFSDDLLWLPFVVSFYVEKTGDRTVLDEVVPFLEAAPVDPTADSDYTQPAVSSEKGTILEHCARALDRSLRTGSHGLPLMGTGDWNDGMSRVGHEGKGESVWVAWFLHSTIEKYIRTIETKPSARTETYAAHAKKLKVAVEENAWDGDWYRRAYFDDGSPMGSAKSLECRIDSIAQSWAVLSGAGDPQRAARAMAAVDQYLIDRGEGLVKLFTPPFDKSPQDPGYIKGYVPGVRENGGQYTHAAIWTLMAFAELGDGDRAGELYELLNPISHSSTRAGLNKYKVEPYVVAADVYGMFPHIGRGGWTWYTGSASWMYRAALESILGFDLRGDTLRLKPCIPKLWPGFQITYRHGGTRYSISVTNRTSDSEPFVEMDGTRQSSPEIKLVDDGKPHTVRVFL